MLNRWPLLAVLLLLPLVAGGRAGAQEEAQLWVDPPAQNVGLGDVPFEVRVMVDNVTTADGLGGYTLVMNFDPAILKGRTITDTGYVASTGNPVICPASAIDNDEGVLAHLCFTLPIIPAPGPQASNPQALVRISFEPVAAGTATLDISETTIVDPQGNTLAATTTNGQVTVGGGPGAGPSVTEEPAGNSPTATPAAGGTQLPPSGSRPDDGTGPTALYIGLIVAGIVGLAALSAVTVIARRRRAS